MLQSLKQNKFKVIAALALAVLAMFGVIDPAVAGVVFLIGDVEPTSIKELNAAMQTAFKAMESARKTADEVRDAAVADLKKKGDTIEATLADKLKLAGEETAKTTKAFKDSVDALGVKVHGVEQKMDGMRLAGAPERSKSTGDLFIESEVYKDIMKKTNNGQSKNGWDSAIFDFDRKTLIANPTPLSNNNPLVRPDRLPGIIGPGLRRFTVRDLLPNLRTTSNLIEFASELLFTNNAAPQFDPASAGSLVTEGALKAESGLTFQLSNAPVITLAHYIPASRQILRDAAGLAGYIDARLTYGLKLVEEDQLLNGTGTSGALTGLRTGQTAFNGGATNQSAIDTLLKALTQVSLSYFEASGFVLHPVDWQNILLQKDTQGRYLFGDPHSFTSPSIWGKPVVVTQAITQGQFLCGAFDLAAAIWDAEDISIRIAEQHADWFARNLVAILCEERLALTIFRALALVGGAITYAG